MQLTYITKVHLVPVIVLRKLCVAIFWFSTLFFCRGVICRDQSLHAFCCRFVCRVPGWHGRACTLAPVTLCLSLYVFSLVLSLCRSLSLSLLLYIPVSLVLSVSPLRSQHTVHLHAALLNTSSRPLVCFPLSLYVCLWSAITVYSFLGLVFNDI